MGGGSKRISPLLSMLLSKASLLLRTLTGTNTASYEPIAPSLWATQGDLRPRLRRATKWHACSLLFCFVAFSFFSRTNRDVLRHSVQAGRHGLGQRQTANCKRSVDACPHAGSAVSAICGSAAVCSLPAWQECSRQDQDCCSSGGGEMHRDERRAEPCEP